MRIVGWNFILSPSQLVMFILYHGKNDLSNRRTENVLSLRRSHARVYSVTSNSFGTEIAKGVSTLKLPFALSHSPPDFDTVL